MVSNPFSAGENRILRPQATAVVIFGASGDLTHRKLVPALYNLAHDDYLPSNFVVVGASRTPISDQKFREGLYESVKKFSRRKVEADVWEKFSKSIFYQALDGNKTEDFIKLHERLRTLGAAYSEPLNYLYYLSTSPDHFGPIASNLKRAGLVENPHNAQRATSIIVEKPFGHDLESAKALNLQLRESFAEDQIFRIDHYLGKETVQNILVFRFANGIFEPLWNRKYIDSIEISACESIGVGSRAGYFDSHGILRDFVQNHVLQILSLLCIEPPQSLSDADSIRDEKVKVLRSIKRLSIEDVRQNTVRAQYAAGFVDGQPAQGYLEEKGVPATSVTETYAALKLEIDNWRWAGVPIYIRAAKRLPKRITEITVLFNRAPDALFRGRQVGELEQNALTIQVQPNEGIALRINSKPPGPRMRVRPVDMDFSYDSSFGVESPEAYERLILDAMKGDATLFTRNDEIEESWDLLAPILETWKTADGAPLHKYEAGTWGPQAAAELLKPNSHRWRRL